MKSALYVGTISHTRWIPREHRFQYPFFMWFLNLDELEQLPSMGFCFSAKRWALSRFYRPDYYGDPIVPLADAIRGRMEELTGEPVTGQVCGLMNMRTLGLYFSPVNFYYGYDKEGTLSHFLAEVSNIPWNERHQYCHYLLDKGLMLQQKKEFHVSPFNPETQRYSWDLKAPQENISVGLSVDDDRGKIFQAFLNLQRHPLTIKSVTRQLLKKPVMTVFIVAGVYWQALKLYIKGVPYVPYEKETL